MDEVVRDTARGRADGEFAGSSMAAAGRVIEPPGVLVTVTVTAKSIATSRPIPVPRAAGTSGAGRDTSRDRLRCRLPWRTFAASSQRRAQAICAQAIQTTTAIALITVVDGMLPCWMAMRTVSQSGTACGNGQPAMRIRSIGTPTTNTARTMSANSARRPRVGRAMSASFGSGDATSSGGGGRSRHTRPEARCGHRIVDADGHRDGHVDAIDTHAAAVPRGGNDRLGSLHGSVGVDHFARAERVRVRLRAGSGPRRRRRHALLAERSTAVTRRSTPTR